MAVAIRPLTERDIDAAGDVAFVAFWDVAVRHGARPSVTSAADSRGYLRFLLSIDPTGGLVAEDSGTIIGLAWVHPRGPVATIGPVAVDPRSQGRGVGRALLAGALEAIGPRTPQVRLVQDAFNDVSLGLYLRSGFRVVAPLLDLEHQASAPLVPTAAPPGVQVRVADSTDRTRLVERDARAFGVSRAQNVDVYLRHGRIAIAERGTAVAAYAMAFAAPGVVHVGSAAGDDPDAVVHLVGCVAADLQGGVPGAVRVLVPATDRRLVDGLLAMGFRVFRACLYMARGAGSAPPPGYVLMNGDMM